MVGIPGAGGKKGRSGVKPKVTDTGERALPHTVYLAPADRALARERGPDWVRAAIREKAERETAS